MDAPAVAVRDATVIAAAWMDLRAGGNNRRIYWVRLGGDNREMPIAEIAGGIQGHPSMAMDGNGAIHVAWEDFREDVQRIHYRRQGEKDVAISPVNGKGSFPSLACGKVVGVAFEHGGNVVFASPPG